MHGTQKLHRKRAQTIALSPTNIKETEQRPHSETQPNPSTQIPISSDESESEQKVFEIYQLIRQGATSFLWAEYKYLAIYIAVFSLIICGAITYGAGGIKKIQFGLLSAVAFFIGAITSIIAGYIGMFSIC